MNIAAFDVGLSGALCIMSPEGRIVDLLDMPVISVGKSHELDEPRIRDILKEWEIRHCFIEKAQSMPGRKDKKTGDVKAQGVASTAHYMASYGILRGICVGLSIPYTLVHPATWKAAIMKDMPKGDKGQDIIRAKQLWPDLKMDRKKDHGRADAALICEYGRRMGG